MGQKLRVDFSYVVLCDILVANIIYRDKIDLTDYHTMTTFDIKILLDCSVPLRQKSMAVCLQISQNHNI